ncbi:MAG: 30S ribosomal protein S13 [Elusimicrobia bacterium CG08_land_8_20_14_0_20_44_26]|nr:MAG: 30S ribosomal protein S13 [Elusimicrobia bacterium CG08_land_8_20_14_0_20_44_26]
MARISGVELPINKRLEIGLTYIYGIGRSVALKIIKETGLSPGKKIKELTDVEVAKIQKLINENYKVEGDLRRQVQGNIRHLMEIGCYRGFRHRKGLPVRGQRTRTNARTRKGKKKTVKAAKKEAPKKDK